MMRLLLHVIIVMLVLMTCYADRLRKLESQMKLMKAVQSLADTRLEILEADVGSISGRVAKLEALVNESDDDIVSKRSRTKDNLSSPNVKHELNNIKTTLKMYKHTFSKQKQEFIDANYVIKDTLSVFQKNLSSVIKSLVNIVNDHVTKSAANISATLEHINNASVESVGQLRSEILTCLENISSEVKTDMHIHFEGIKQDSNKTVYAIKYQVHDQLANETKRLDQFKTNILQNVNAIRSDAQNKNNEIQKKLEGLIGRANEVVGIIDDKRSTIKEDIMVTIRELHSSWNDWSAWSYCSQISDRGSRRRHRTCSAPPPLTDAICVGNTETEELCAYDCSDVLTLGLSHGSGLYKITPRNTHREVDVYCDMDTDGGGWTVFQRRWNGSVSFNRSFVDYERGFGSLDGEFWMGLGLLHTMTSRANMTVRVDLSLMNETTGFDEYSGFFLSPPDRYNFNVDRRTNSRGMSDSDLLSQIRHTTATNHQPFSTYDRDVDHAQDFNAAQTWGGGWWYTYFPDSSLNGKYDNNMCCYRSFTNRNDLKTSSMMFRLSNLDLARTQGT